MSFHGIDTERFTAADSRFRENLKLENVASSFVRLRPKIAPLICGVVVAVNVAVVTSSAPD